MSSIAIIGQGYMANTHAAAWATLGKADSIKYICTPRPTQGSVTASTNAQYIAELETVLQDEEVNFVSVCTPTPTHKEVTLALLAAGKHVLLEKPIALTVEDALIIADAANNSNGSLMMAQVARFFAGYQRMREASEAGQLGDVLSVRARRLSPKPAWATWITDESLSGGMLVDFSIHDFDQLNLFMGNPIEVYATQAGPTAPAETTVRYEGGGVGHVESFMNNSDGVPFTATIDVLGTSGLGHYEFSAASATEEAGSESGAIINSWYVFSGSGNHAQTISEDDPYGRQIEYFWKQANGERAYDEAPVSAGIVSLEVALAAKQSLREGRPIAVASVLDG